MPELFWMRKEDLVQKADIPAQRQRKRGTHRGGRGCCPSHAGHVYLLLSRE